MIKKPIKRYGQVWVIMLYSSHICLASQQKGRALNFLDLYSLNQECKRVVKSWWLEDSLWSGFGDLGDDWGPYKDPEMTSDEDSPMSHSWQPPPGERQRPPALVLTLNTTLSRDSRHLTPEHPDTSLMSGVSRQAALCNISPLVFVRLTKISPFTFHGLIRTER